MLIETAVAFCFYNLSSIVNGLVYFDQIGALTTVHLCLVILGMFVLLGGVWAVSVTSGDGGGVEPGTWHEGGEAMREEEMPSPERPGLHRRNVSLPSSPLDVRPASPRTASDTMSPPRSRRMRQRRYSTLLGTEVQGSTVSGLSIGLSPVSPGFALRPARRRNASMAGVGSEAAMRRTVSEADVGAGGSRRGKARWRWLREVLKGRDGDGVT